MTSRFQAGVTIRRCSGMPSVFLRTRFGLPTCSQKTASWTSLRREPAVRCLRNERVAVFVEYVPALQVGGDYACIHSVGEDQLCLLVGDVSGHGITSSLLMSRLSREIERMVKAGEDLCLMAEALNKENTGMDTMLGQECLYLTLFGAVIDFFSQRMSYINCGHPGQLLWSQPDQTVIRLESQNLPPKRNPPRLRRGR